MTRVVNCPVCGVAAEVPRCRSCGAELVTGRVARPRDSLVNDRDQSACDQDQTLSDKDQTASDQDQTWSDHDQSASARDQQSADEDQHAADDDLAAGGDQVAHRRSALTRARTSHDRAAVEAVRDETAAARMKTASDRDRAAAARDRAAEDRDELARQRDLEDASRDDIILRAKRDRARAADDRARAAADRQEAARERIEALRQSAATLELAAIDELTGAWTRKFGLEEVSGELERAHRNGTKLLLAFVDVDGLKQINDTHGHQAGDDLLRLLGETLRANLRAYDVIVRYGGDELLCAMPNLKAADARARLEKLATPLRAGDVEQSVTFGLAEAEPGDTLEALIARADSALLGARRTAKRSD